MTITPDWRPLESDNIEAVGSLGEYAMCVFGGTTELPEPELLPFRRIPVAGEWIDHAGRWWAVYRVYWTDGKARLELSHVS